MNKRYVQIFIKPVLPFLSQETPTFSQSPQQAQGHRVHLHAACTRVCPVEEGPADALNMAVFRENERIYPLKMAQL